jgi:hypothetical protein
VRLKIDCSNSTVFWKLPLLELQTMGCASFRCNLARVSTKVSASNCIYSVKNIWRQIWFPGRSSLCQRYPRTALARSLRMISGWLSRNSQFQAFLMAQRILSVVALAIIVFVAGTRGALSPDKRVSFPPHKTAGSPAKGETFECNKDNSKMQTLNHLSGKHTVVLSWKPSVSLSNPPAKNEGYNVYRLNPDRSCTKINEDLIRDTDTKDGSVELGKTYSYGARAVKRNRESKPSNVVEVSIPPK